MKKNLVIFTFFFFAVSLLLQAAPPANAGSGSQKPEKEIKLDESFNGKSVVLQKGQYLAVCLFENRTTGFRWTIEDYRPSILELQEPTYLPSNPSGCLKPVGSGGTKVFTFQGKRSGETSLKIAYQRPWAETPDPAKTFSVTITVGKVMGGLFDKAQNGLPSGVQAAQLTIGQSRSGPEMSLGLSLKSLKAELSALEDAELKATSAVEFRVGNPKEYTGFIIIRNDSERPRCPHDKLPMDNKALKTMVNAILTHYGKKAESRKLAFLQGGFVPPGFCEVTLSGTALGLPFNTSTGKPMGKLTGTL